MALLTCQECGRPVSDQAESCPDCGRRTEFSEARARSMRHVAWAMQACSGLAILVGASTFLLMLLPDLDTTQTVVIFRIAFLFVFLGIAVWMLGWFAGRAPRV